MGCFLFLLVEIAISIWVGIKYGEDSLFLQLLFGGGTFFFLNMIIFSGGGFHDEPP